MAEFNVEENLGIIIRLMMVTGIWPKRSPSAMYMLRTCATISLMVLLLLTNLTQAFKFVDMQSSSFALSCSMSTLQAIIKCLVLLTERKHFSNLLRMLHEPILSLHDDHLYILLMTRMKTSRTFQNGFLYVSVVTGVTIIVSSMFTAESERPLPMPFPMDMEKQSLAVYVLVWVLQSYEIILVCVTLGCIDGLTLFFNSMASAQLRILREKVMESTNFQSYDSERNEVQNLNDTVIKLLKDCVIQHLAIERYVLGIQTVFGKIFLLQLSISLLLICFLGFLCALVPITSTDFGMAFVFFLSVSMQIALLCVPGNEITVQSTRIRDACYMTKWFECDLSVRKSLFIIMERSKRPFKLSAASFVFLSLETLMSVFRAAYSYFTLLRRMYYED